MEHIFYVAVVSLMRDLDESGAAIGTLTTAPTLVKGGPGPDWAGSRTRRWALSVGGSGKEGKGGGLELHAHGLGLCPHSADDSGGCSPPEIALCRTAHPLILFNEHLWNMADFVLNTFNPAEVDNIIAVSQRSKQTRKLSTPTQGPAGTQIRESDSQAGPFITPCMASHSVKTECVQGFPEHSKDPYPAPPDSERPHAAILANSYQQFSQPHLSFLFWQNIPSGRTFPHMTEHPACPLVESTHPASVAPLEVWDPGLKPTFRSSDNTM